MTSTSAWWRWCIDEARGRVPVIAGAGSNSTREAIELAAHAEKAGADAVLVVTPYYNKPTQEGLYQHFKAINDAIGIPIIIYNIPPRSVIDMSVDTMKRLFELKNIAGVKDATANVARVSQQRAAMGEDFNQFSGEDVTALGLAHGGHGCISVTSNVAPRLCSEPVGSRGRRRFCQGPVSSGQADARCTPRPSWRPASPGQDRPQPARPRRARKCGCLWSLDRQDAREPSARAPGPRRRPV